MPDDRDDEYGCPPPEDGREDRDDAEDEEEDEYGCPPPDEDDDCDDDEDFDDPLDFEDLEPLEGPDE